MRRRVIVLAAASAVMLSAGLAQAQSAAVKRGEYIVTRVGTCADCHSPMDATGKVPAGKALAGAPIAFAPTAPIPGWAPVAPPIAGGPVGYSQAQLVAFLETGKKPNGSLARPPMPAFRLTHEDAQGVAAYLMSLKRR